MEKYIADVWTKEGRFVNYAVTKINVEEYLEEFLEGRTLFDTEEEAKSAALQHIKENYDEYERYNADDDIPEYTDKF